MKKIFQIAAVFIILLLMTSCYYSPVGNSVDTSGRGDLYVPFSYSMPLDGGYYGTYYATKNLPLKVIETDEYGRTLCSLSFQYYSNAFFKKGEAYCIVQKSSDTETSFYEDICCAGVASLDDSEPVIMALKKANDWDQPLNESKMTTIPFRGLDPMGAYEIKEEEEAYEDVALDFLGLDDYGCYYDIICKDRYGRVMISLSYPKKNEVYLVIMRGGSVLNGSDSVQKIEDMNSPWEEIHELKQRNRWGQSD